MNSTINNKEIYIFDVDGTLTPSREGMDPKFASFFNEFVKNREVYLASGSDLGKIQEQLTEETLMSVAGVFTCMGNVFHQYGKKIYQNEFKEPKELRKDLKSLLFKSKFPLRYGNHIEDRVGMINYSIPGRNISIEQRKQYVQYDKENNERILLTSYLNNKYEGKIEASVGGEISIDIINPGKDKSQVISFLKDNELINVDTFINFYGDRVEHGGNDFALAHAIRLSAHDSNIISVNCWQDTYDKLMFMRQEQTNFNIH